MTACEYGSFRELNRENGEVDPFCGTTGPGLLIGRAAAPTSFGCTSYRCARSATLDCSRNASNAIFAFRDASIYRLVFHPLRLARRNGSRSNYAAGPKSGVHFIKGGRRSLTPTRGRNSQPGTPPTSWKARG